MKRLILAVAVMAACLFAASAHAAVRCVPSAGAGCDSDHATIASAIDSAADGDTIRLAAGVYAEAVSTDKDLIFEGAASGTLDSAVGATVIRPAASVAVLASGSLELRSLRVEAPASSPAIMLQPDPAQSEAYLLDDVVAIGGSGALAGQGVLVNGADDGTTTSVAVVDSEIQAGAADAGGSGGSALHVGTGSGEDPPVEVDIVGSRLVGGASGPPGRALALYNALAVVIDSVAEAPLGVDLRGGDFLISHSRITASGESSANGLMVADLAGVPETWAWVSDSLITAASTSAGATAILARGTSAIPVDLTVVGSTAVAEGGEPTVGVHAHRTGSTQPTILLGNSVAAHRGPEASNSSDIHSQGAVVEAFNSSFRSTHGSVAGFVTPDFYENDNVWTDPLLSSSFAPLAGSPLIDAGDPELVAEGDFDLAGVSRLQDGSGDCVGVPDIGAFEYVALTCTPVPPSGGSGGGPFRRRPVRGPIDKRPEISDVSLLRSAFTARKPRTKGRRRGTVLRYTLSEAARVVLTIERRAAGRLVAGGGLRRCVKPTRRNAGRPACKRYLDAGTVLALGEIGPNGLKLSGRVGRRILAPGVYRAKLTATDSLGQGSIAKTLRFRVLRP